jgi:hypothetical protein
MELLILSKLIDSMENSLTINGFSVLVSLQHLIYLLAFFVLTKKEKIINLFLPY